LCCFTLVSSCPSCFDDVIRTRNGHNHRYSSEISVPVPSLSLERSRTAYRKTKLASTNLTGIPLDSVGRVFSPETQGWATIYLRRVVHFTKLTMIHHQGN
jgi:hypothetical protein